MSKRKLETYLARRDFRKTPEPAGGDRKTGAAPLFVIHEHAASTHHYDFRLEIDGVLASWAVPKGPSTDPREKRLAVRTEDHPLDYADFEGRIPADEYGGGAVLVWDAGSYRNLKLDDDGDETKSLADGLTDGHLTVWLDGEKLNGGYALTRFRRQNGKEHWLLVKMNDEAADARRNPINTERESVLSGRVIDDLIEDDEEA